MTSTKQNSLDFSYVDAILDHFFEVAVSSSFRPKAISVMCVLISRSGGYDKPTDLTATNLAEMFNISVTALYETFDLLISTNMIHREQSGERGNRLIITPLSPSKWKLPSGKKYMKNADGSFSISHGISPLEDNNVDFEFYNKVKVEVMQPNWNPIYEKIISFIESPNDLTATDPSKLLGMMVVIIQNTQAPGESCTLNQREIGTLISQNDASVGKILKILEDIGVVKRVWGQGKKIITPIMPKNLDSH